MKVKYYITFSTIILYSYFLSLGIRFFPWGNFQACGYHFLFLMYFLPINLIILVVELFKAEKMALSVQNKTYTLLLANLGILLISILSFLPINYICCIALILLIVVFFWISRKYYEEFIAKN
jgi:hypothetical protein